MTKGPRAYKGGRGRGEGGLPEGGAEPQAGIMMTSKNAPSLSVLMLSLLHRSEYLKKENAPRRQLLYAMNPTKFR